MSDQVFGGANHSGRPARPIWQAMARGSMGKCPRCGNGRLFASFIKTAEACEACGEAFHHHRADDLPAYLVVVIVGHLVVGAFMGVEAVTQLTLLQHMLIWVPVTFASALLLLRPVKGAVVGLQWALYMHGFGDEPEPLETHPEL